MSNRALTGGARGDALILFCANHFCGVQKMRFQSSYRSILLAGSAITLLAACTQADVDDIASPGDGTPIDVTVIDSGGGASSFASRSTAPITAAECPTGTTFTPAVDVLSTGATTNFCSLTPIGGGVVTGTVNVPFSADPILISGTVFIGDETTPANVTFAAGQQFVSQSAAGVVDLLVVSRGSTLTAVGNASAPIIFTSMNDFNDDGMPNGTGSTGDWGGLAINGAAPLNECGVDSSAMTGSANCEQLGEGGSGIFGGDQAGDSSGNFQFIRVQHAGFQFTPTNELNGIALQGVGNGTTFENVQVHDGADDGFEWFGGTVDGRNLIVTGAGDDSFDWTDGWTGSVQFMVAVQNPGDDNGIEGDNETPFDAMPRSNPQLSNLTLIGSGQTTSGEGVLLRVGTDANIANAVVTGFSQGVEFDNGGEPGTVNPTLNSFFIAGNASNVVDSQPLLDAGANNVVAGANTLEGVFPGPAELAVQSTSPETIDASFDPSADFVGAFGPGDSPTSNFTVGWTVPGSIPGAAPGCPAGTLAAAETPQSINASRTESLVCIITSPVAGDVTLTSGNLYRLDGSTFVGVDGGPDPANPVGAAGNLTVAPGVTIFGNQQAGVVDLLTVTRGSELNVAGTQTLPVILTSRADLVNGETVRPGVTGEIGGIAINGRAPLNECGIDASATPGDIDCEQLGEGGSGPFGGATPDDSSGSINFMQVRYAGFQFTPTNELNAVALQGAGSGTDIDFIQVLNGSDDGIEWFGGNASASHVVILGAGDDSLDWTDGWSGTVQFAIVNQTATTFAQDNGIEGDNETPFDVLPRSRPFMTNMTFLGAGGGEGVLLRVGTGGTVANSVVSGFAQGFEFDDQSTVGVVPTVSAVAVSENATDLVDTATLNMVGDGIVTFANNTLGPIAGFPNTPIAPGANETAPAITANADVVGLCNAEFAALPAAEALSVDAAPFTAQPNQCGTLEDADFVGAIADENDTWFAGWTIGL